MGNKMVMPGKTLLGFVACVLVLSSPAAWAAHGKAGLWNVTSTTSLDMTMPPGMQDHMKDMKAPAPESHTTQMCMSQEEVNSDRPPHIDQRQTGCDTHVTSMSGTSLSAELTCNGAMKGSGHMRLTYTGAEHYRGSYDFKGTVENNPTTMRTTFHGDWVKADCGDVRPYRLRTQ